MSGAIIISQDELKKTLSEISHEILSGMFNEIKSAQPDSRSVMTVRQLAAYLQVTEQSIFNWIKRAENPLPVGYAGSDPRFFADEVREWMKREAFRKLHKEPQNITETKLVQ